MRNEQKSRFMQSGLHYLRTTHKLSLSGNCSLHWIPLFLPASWTWTSPTTCSSSCPPIKFHLAYLTKSEFILLKDHTSPLPWISFVSWALNFPGKLESCANISASRVSYFRSFYEQNSTQLLVSSNGYLYIFHLEMSIHTEETLISSALSKEYFYFNVIQDQLLLGRRCSLVTSTLMIEFTCMDLFAWIHTFVRNGVFILQLKTVIYNLFSFSYCLQYQYLHHQKTDIVSYLDLGFLMDYEDGIVHKTSREMSEA